MYFLLLRMLDVNIVLVALIMQKGLEPPQKIKSFGFFSILIMSKN